MSINYEKITDFDSMNILNNTDIIHNKDKKGY